MKFIENMLLYSIHENGLNYNEMLEYCKIYAADKRFKPFILAATCAWSYCNHSGIIRYRNEDYYFRFVNKDAVIVERR